MNVGVNSTNAGDSRYQTDRRNPEHKNPPGAYSAAVTDTGYLVDIKSSARRVNAPVGSYVQAKGTCRQFDCRDDADEWAADISDDHTTVWVRDANPNDASDVDGYLMAYLRDHDVTLDEEPGQQGGLEQFGVRLLDLDDEETGAQVPLGRFHLDG